MILGVVCGLLGVGCFVGSAGQTASLVGAGNERTQY